LSHGDTRHPLLLPASVEECYQLSMEAFDLAEQLQTPVFVLSDLDLGMNTWMSEPFPYPEKPVARGKLLTPEKVRELGEWGRYKDVDGDAVPYRSIPLDGMPSYFARGSGHNERGQYSERPDDYVRNMDRLSRKFETARSLVPRPEVTQVEDAAIGMVAYGTSHWATVESRDQLAGEAGIRTSYLRLRAWPFTEELTGFIDRHERVYMIEQNRDGQMLALLRQELSPERIAKLRSIRHYDGLPLDARSVTDALLEQEGHALARKAVEAQRTAVGGSVGVGGE
jgi:2-oxoglutarate ferredoxin oxidoreductase subunit alpha